MPKRDIEDFISDWSKADAFRNQISQPFFIDLCELLEVPQPGIRLNGSYTFEFHVKEKQPDGTTKMRILIYKRACFILESKKFQQAEASQPTQLDLTARKFGVTGIPRKLKSGAIVCDTPRWDDAMLKFHRFRRICADDALPPRMVQSRADDLDAQADGLRRKPDFNFAAGVFCL